MYNSSSLTAVREGGGGRAVNIAITHYSRLQEILGLNLDWDTGYMFWDSISIRLPSKSFLFINISTIRHYIMKPDFNGGKALG
jgi:hypothetical protein